MMTANLPLPGHDTDMNPRLLLLCMIVLLSATNVAHARTYLVEMVIFARSAGLGAEHWRGGGGYPGTGNAVNIGAVGSGRFASLPASKMELNNIAATLRNRAGYRVLSHVGWVQPGLSANKSIKVNVSSGSLQGTARVSLAHYLHLNMDLRYSAGPDGPTVRMKQKRRMRSREIHYLDGPVLGVIVLMTPAG